jgi:hypothetical protein
LVQLPNVLTGDFTKWGKAPFLDAVGTDIALQRSPSWRYAPARLEQDDGIGSRGLPRADKIARCGVPMLWPD